MDHPLKSFSKVVSHQGHVTLRFLVKEKHGKKDLKNCGSWWVNT